MTTNTLHSARVHNTLARLHQEAKGDRWKFLGLLPRLLIGKLTGQSFSQVISPEALKGCYIPISREQGEYLYLMVRATGAKQVVEFGTSFGISTIYLAAGVRDNGGGSVVGTEIEPSKHERAAANLAEAGLDDLVDVRLGDALQTLTEVPGPVDLVLIDGWKDLYLPVLKLLKPRLRPGAIVMADNIFTFKRDLRPYVDYVQSGANGFESTTLHISDGFELSVCTG